MAERSEFFAHTNLDPENNGVDRFDADYDKTGLPQMTDAEKDAWVAAQPKASVPFDSPSRFQPVDPFTQSEARVAEAITSGEKVVVVSRDENFGVPLDPSVAMRREGEPHIPAQRGAAVSADTKAALEALLAEGDDRYINATDRQESQLAIDRASEAAKKTIAALQSLREQKANDPDALQLIDARIAALQSEIVS